MIKKITTIFAVIAFASSASVALACNPACSGKKGDDKDGGTGLTGVTQFEVAGNGCSRSCGDKKRDDA